MKEVVSSSAVFFSYALLAVNSVSALIDRTEERLYRLLHRLPSERKEAAE